MALTTAQTTARTKDLLSALGGVEVALHAFAHAASIQAEGGAAADTAAAADAAALQTIATRLRTAFGMETAAP